MKMNYDNYAKLLLGPDLLKEIEVELASRRLYDFVKPAWAVLEPGTVFVPGWHIGAICEHLEAITSGQIRNLLITVPPRHMLHDKSRGQGVPQCRDLAHDLRVV